MIGVREVALNPNLYPNPSTNTRPLAIAVLIRALLSLLVI